MTARVNQSFNGKRTRGLDGKWAVNVCFVFAAGFGLSAFVDGWSVVIGALIGWLIKFLVCRMWLMAQPQTDFEEDAISIAKVSIVRPSTCRLATPVARKSRKKTKPVEEERRAKLQATGDEEIVDEAEDGWQQASGRRQVKRSNSGGIEEVKRTNSGRFEEVKRSNSGRVEEARSAVPQRIPPAVPVSAIGHDDSGRRTCQPDPEPRRPPPIPLPPRAVVSRAVLPQKPLAATVPPTSPPSKPPPAPPVPKLPPAAPVPTAELGGKLEAAVCDLSTHGDNIASVNADCITTKEAQEPEFASPIPEPAPEPTPLPPPPPSPQESVPVPFFETPPGLAVPIRLDTPDLVPVEESQVEAAVAECEADATAPPPPPPGLRLPATPLCVPPWPQALIEGPPSPPPGLLASRVAEEDSVALPLGVAAKARRGIVPRQAEPLHVHLSSTPKRPACPEDACSLSLEEPAFVQLGGTPTTMASTPTVGGEWKSFAESEVSEGSTKMDGTSFAPTPDAQFLSQSGEELHLPFSNIPSPEDMANNTELPFPPLREPDQTALWAAMSSGEFGGLWNCNSWNWWNGEYAEMPSGEYGDAGSWAWNYAMAGGFCAGMEAPGMEIASMQPVPMESAPLFLDISTAGGQ